MRKLLQILLVLVIVYSSVRLYGFYKESAHLRSLNNELETILGKEDEELKFLTKEGFDTLKEMNSDFIGYLYYPSLDIYEPVVQTTNNSYYLKHSLQKEYVRFGAVFADKAYEQGDKNKTLYGHWSPDGTERFTNIHELRDEESYKGKETFYYVDKDTVTTYEVVKVIELWEDNDYATTPYWLSRYSPGQFEEFLLEAKTRELYDTGKELTYDDQTITLQTCVQSGKFGRLAVVGKEVSKEPTQAKGD